MEIKKLEIPKPYDFEYKVFDELEVFVGRYIGRMWNDNLDYTHFQLCNKFGKQLLACCLNQIEYDKDLLTEATEFYIKVYEQMKRDGNDI